MAQQKTEAITTAEGTPIPTVIPEAAEAVRAQIAAAPKPADYQREWNTWVATADLFVDGRRAVNKGGAVPATHPMLQDGEWGNGWVTDGLVEPTGQYDVPQAAETPLSPGGVTYPGGSPA